MKAPEKLYFNQHTAQYNHERRNDDDIEYSRTDSFIEKTEKFMNTVNEYLYHCVSEECDYVDTDKFIEDFKNFIKGE